MSPPHVCLPLLVALAGGAVAITGSMRMKAEDVAAAQAAGPEASQGTGAIEEGAKQEGRVGG
jgi:hypothetical protein